MKRAWPLFLCTLFCATMALGRMESRLYGYAPGTLEEVEAMIRALVPEGPRVRVNPNVQQILVLADAETHGRIEELLERVDLPPAHMEFWFRRNRESHRVEWMDGETGTLPVSSTPPAEVVERARPRIRPGQRQDVPVVGTTLQVHAILLRREPATVRLRLTPVVLFGSSPPYDPVVFEEWATDVMINETSFVDLGKTLGHNDFYRTFFQTQPEPNLSPRPVGLLISLESVRFETESSEEPLE